MQWKLEIHTDFKLDRVPSEKLNASLEMYSQTLLTLEGEHLSVKH